MGNGYFRLGYISTIAVPVDAMASKKAMVTDVS
jgi:hypothetical protein